MGMDVVTQSRRATRKKYSAEEKIRIVLEGLPGEIPISELCRREGLERPRVSPPPPQYDGGRSIATP